MVLLSLATQSSVWANGIYYAARFSWRKRIPLSVPFSAQNRPNAAAKIGQIREPGGNLAHFLVHAAFSQKLELCASIPRLTPALNDRR
jgi:hypothetical protein